MRSRVETPIESTEDLVRQHGDYLRRLALALVRDEAAAHDVAQETWRVALERADTRVEHSRAWLGGIARRIAWRRVREDRRRAAREADVARPESDPAEPSLAWGDTLQSALRRLDEPFRESVVLRYMQGLPPREIAKRTGVPLETVKSRLKRGLAALRRDLDRQHGGDRRAWSLGLVGALELPRVGEPSGLVSRGPQSAPATESLATPSIAMGIKLLASAAIVASISALVFHDSERTDRSAVDVDTADSERRDATTQLAEVDGNAAGRSEEGVATTAAQPDSAALAEEALAMHFELRDHVGDPLPAIEVQIAPPGHPFVVAGRTDDEGMLSIAWESHVPSMTVDVAFAMWGTRDIGGLHRVEVQRGTMRHVVLQVDPSRTSQFELRAAADKGDTLRQPATNRRRATGRSRPIRGESPSSGGGWIEISAEPAQPVLEDVTNALDDLRAQVALVEFALDDMTVPGLGYGGGIGTFDVADETLPGKAVVEGSVTDEFGRAAPRYPVRYVIDGEPSGNAVLTDEEGRYRIEVPAKSVRLRAGVGSDLVEWKGELENGQTFRWSPRVLRGRDALIQLASAQGHDADGILVQVRHDDGKTLWIGRAATDSAGLATIYGCPAERIDVHLIPPEKSLAVAFETLEGVPTGSPWSHEINEGELAAPLPFDFTPRDGDRWDACATELIVLDESRSWGQRVRIPGALGSTVSGVLASGSWWLELATRRTGRREIGAVHVLGEQPIALGAIDLGPVGELALEGGESTGSTVLVHWVRDDVDSRIAELPAEELPQVLTVPHGSYRVTVTQKDGRVEAMRVEVR
ncbi:MAG: RNA polymerase sigma factor [Planctomycetota bacterium]